jgi:hypothetical protein
VPKGMFLAYVVLSQYIWLHTDRHTSVDSIMQINYYSTVLNQLKKHINYIAMIVIDILIDSLLTEADIKCGAINS